MVDCELLAKVYINLIDQKEPKLNFHNIDNEFKSNNNSKVPYFKKIIRASSDELKAHEEYLKNNLKKNNF